MTRQIAFRVWDKKEKKMFYPTYYFSFDHATGETAFDKSHWAKREVMQFTGLTDRHGKEIYESDLVNIDGMVVKVEWYNGAWTVEYFTSPKRSYLSTFDETDIEVVGNVYEHHHLLKSGEGDIIKS